MTNFSSENFFFGRNSFLFGILFYFFFLNNWYFYSGFNDHNRFYEIVFNIDCIVKDYYTVICKYQGERIK